MRIQRTALNLSKVVLLDLLDTLNDMDVLLSKGEGVAKVQRDILEYQNLLVSSIKPLLR